MAEMITVSALDTLRACVVGRDDKTLAAFNPALLASGENGRRPDCRYRYPDFPGVACAIGKGLPDEFADALDDRQNSQTVWGLNGVDFGGHDTLTMLRELQERHDAAVTSKPGSDRKNKRANFNRYLDAQLALLEEAA